MRTQTEQPKEKGRKDGMTKITLLIVTAASITKASLSKAGFQSGTALRYLLHLINAYAVERNVSQCDLFVLEI